MCDHTCWLLQLGHGILSVESCPKCAAIFEGRLEDRFDDDLRRHLGHPVSNGS
jgi:hypothetical protein